jgi:hypothetical protein
LLLAHTPPTVGASVVLFPIQICGGPETVAKGLTYTFILTDVSEAQPVEVSVKINLADPGDTALTIPELSMDATDGWVLDQVPPALGKKLVVLAGHRDCGPESEMIGLPFTNTGAVGSEAHPPVLWKVKLATP